MGMGIHAGPALGMDTKKALQIRELLRCGPYGREYCQEETWEPEFIHAP